MTLNFLKATPAISQFRSVAGTLEFDAANATACTLSVTIDTASIDTNDAAGDEHLRSPDFFSAVEVPTLTFAATAIEVTGDKTDKITAHLTTVGVTKTVTMDVTFNTEAPLLWDASVVKAGFTATEPSIRQTGAWQRSRNLALDPMSQSRGMRKP